MSAAVEIALDRRDREATGVAIDRNDDLLVDVQSVDETLDLVVGGLVGLLGGRAADGGGEVNAQTGEDIAGCG